MLQTGKKIIVLIIECVAVVEFANYLNPNVKTTSYLEAEACLSRATFLLQGVQP